MGHRSWMVAIEDDQDALAVKRWLLNVEHDHGVDWGLTYHSTCMRKDGSIWALIDSDGSSVVSHLAAYGYAPTPERVLLLGEAPQWDTSDGPMGRYTDALHSAYLDAEKHDFLPAPSRALEDQFGEARLILVNDLAELQKVRSEVEALARRLEPRVVPHVGSAYYTVTEAGAQLLGVMVGNLHSDFLKQMTAEIDAAQIDGSKLPENARSGFQIGDMNTVTVWEDEGCYVTVPIMGGTVSDEALIEMAQANKAERFRSRAGKMLQSIGFSGGYGGFSGPDESARDWYKEVDVGSNRIHITASCQSSREVKGNRQSAFINSVELRSWSYTAAVAANGADRRSVSIPEGELEGLATSVEEFERAVRELVSPAA